MATAKKLPSGNWRVLIYMGKGPDGKREYQSFTAPTKREAELAAAEYAYSRPKNAHENLTVGQAIDKYISTKEAVLSPSTIASYRSINRNHLKGIKDTKLKQLTSDMAQMEIGLAAASHSPKTVRNIHTLLTATLKLYAPNLSLNIRLPQKEKIPVRIPTRAEINKIYEAVKGTDMEIPFLLASQAGLRLSEICALTYADVTPGDIYICKAMVPGEKGPILKVPKSYAGYRHVSCDSTLTALIRATQTGADTQRITNLTHSAISLRWPHILKRLGIQHFRFHDLRHYYASEGLLLGVPPKYMAELMGHSSTDMINRVYQHTFADNKKQFAQALADKTAALLKEKQPGN